MGFHLRPIDELNDIGNVVIAAIADDDILYWDEAAGKWQNIAHLGVADAHHPACLPLTGGTLTGDLGIGAHKLKTTDLLLKQVSATAMGVRNAADDARRHLEISDLYLYTDFQWRTSGRGLYGKYEDGAHFHFSIKRTDAAWAEVARVQGAADPYFQATLPIVLLPIATASLPATPVEGMITYDATLDRVVFYDGTDWITIARAIDKYTNAEAKAAAVQAGAITDTVTKAPTHDAVFDVKATANAAIAKALLTTLGDIIRRGAAAPERLGVGSNGEVLTVVAGEPVWGAAPGVPSGVSAMWHGAIVDIPTGWVLCDGNNGTPNLLAKFVEGVATAATNPGATGGEATHALSIAEMPAHTHSYSHSNFSYIATGGGTRAGPIASYTTGSKGGGGAHENKPPFYDIAFIMKI